MQEIPFGRPMIDSAEKNAVAEVLSGHILTHGPKVKQFEADFAKWCGAPHAIAVASCTAALHLAYFYYNISDGDEVIVPAQTHAATAHAVELCGGKAVFVDSEARTGNIDIDQIEAAITPATKAISVVHYLGMPVDMERVMAIADRHGLPVIEDCALAIGTYYKGVHAGLWGDLGCYSFYPVKHITTGEGGMLISKHKSLAQKISQQRAFGIDRNIVTERPIPGVYDVQELGFNYRLNEIGAAMGIEQMKKVDGFLQKRRENYAALHQWLLEIDEIEQLESSASGDFQSSFYCQMIILKSPFSEKRYEIIQGLKARGIGTSIYYPKAVPHMSYYSQKYDIPENAFPVASRISNHGIALPVGPHLGVEDMHTIALNLKAVIAEVSN